MSETIGRVDFIAGLDGRGLPREARNLGKRIGAEGDRAGTDFGSQFDKSATRRIDLAADRMAESLRRGVRLDGSVLKRNRAEIDKFTQDTRIAFEQMFPRTFKAFDVLDRRVKSVGHSFDNLRLKVMRTWDALEVGDGRLRIHAIRWRDLSHNTRQWTLIIGAIAAGMQHLAGLSSALGAGLLAVGGGLSALVLGGGAAVAMFTLLLKDMEDIPPHLRDVAAQFKNLGTVLLDTRELIATSAFAEMSGTFDRLSETVRGLSPVFSTLGTSVGRVFDRFSKGIAVGTDGFSQISRLIELGAENFETLAKAAGTWSLALIRGINRANPIVNQLIGYVQKLGDRFDRFTKSNDFDSWIQQSMQTFTEFGRLLDATARALNDLVTPESLGRTREFLRNLTDFMPNLSRLLNVLGQLDVFGLAAQLLNDFGRALEPLAEPVARLAASVNDVASVLIGEFANALGVIADLIAPLASLLADLVAAIPPEALGAVAAGFVGIATAIGVLRGTQALAGLVADFALARDGSKGFLNVIGGVESGTGKAATMVGRFGRALGVVGVAAGVAIPVITQVVREIQQLDDKARVAASGGNDLGKALNTIVGDFKVTSWAVGDAGKSFSELTGNTRAMQTALDQLAAVQAKSPFLRWAGDLAAVDRESAVLAKGLNELSKPMASLAQTSLPDAQAKMRGYAESVGASRDQVLTMINEMPEYKKVLEDAAWAAEGSASNEALLRAALGETASAAETARAALYELANQQLLANDSSRNYYESLDRLGETLATNGVNLDNSTEAGRRNTAAIDAMAAATLKLSQDTLEQTGSQSQANAVILQGRDALIAQMTQFGYTRETAEAYINQLGLVPDDIATLLALEGVDAALNQIADVVRPRTVPISLQVTGGGTGFDWGGREVTPFASGGVLHGARQILAGEAGPEAIVPLRRPLSMVDPSVRALSAVAQGKSIPAMAGGGVVGGGKSITIEAGAIVVQNATDPEATSIAVMNRVAELVGA